MFLNELSTFLTEKFNEIGSTMPEKFQFVFNAEAAKNTNANIFQGIIKTEDANQLPVKGVKSVKYKYRVELPIPSSLDNENLLKVENIVEQFSTIYNGTNLSLLDGKGVLTMTMANSGQFKTEFGQGNIVPLMFRIDLLYTNSAVTSGDKVWILRDNNTDYIIPYTYEGLVVEKAGKTSLINDRKYAQTLSTSQTKYYHFKFPYDGNNPLCVQLQKDLLDGDPNKTYTLKYYDGKSYTQASPYTTTVVINRNGDTSSNVPDTSFFDLWFTDADDGLNATKYYMALIDNPFDGITENERYFETEAEQQLWFANLISSGANYCEIKAPNLNSLVLTDQIYTNTAVQGGYDVFDLVNKNFAVIKAVRPATADYLIEIRKPSYDDACAMGNVYWRGTIDGQTVYRKVSTPSSSGGGISRDAYNQTISQVWTNERFFYYRVSDAQIGLNKQVNYNLRLNSLQTYYFLQNGDGTRKLNITGSFIEKAHLDRWIYGYEVVNTTLGTKPSQETAIANGYYGKTPDNTTITSTDTFTKITANNYANFTYLYAPIVSFNGKADSKLFEREDLKDVAKRLVARKKLKYATSISGNQAMVNWMNQNIICWCYITIATGTYKVKRYDANTTEITHDLESAINAYGTGNGAYYGYSLLCFPIYYNSSGQIYGVDNLSSPTIATMIAADSFRIFQTLNNDALASVYSMKLSVKPPFNFNATDLSAKYSVSAGGNLWFLKSNDYSDFIPVGTAEILRVSLGRGIFYTWIDYPAPVKFVSDITLPENTFNISEIVGANRNKKWNPKLNSIDYKTLSLTMTGNNFEYDLQKLNIEGNIEFDYYEMLTSDVTKGLLKLSPSMLSNDSVFNTSYGESFNGFLYTNDFSLPYTVDAYSTYIANNKNAYLSFELQQKQSRINDVIGASRGAISGIASGNPRQAIGGVLNAGTDLVQGELNRAFERVQFDLSIDNMKNAPASLANANGNAVFSSAVADFGIYVEIYEALDYELEMANDNMFREGYTVNRFGQVRDCDNIRKHFNYVRAVLGIMQGIPMSDTVRADLFERFSQGIRLWKQDNVEYTKENYEIALQNY